MSSAISTMPFSRHTSHSGASCSAVRHTPVGLLGVLRITALVFGPQAAASASAWGTKPCCGRVATSTGTPPARRTC